MLRRIEIVKGRGEEEKRGIERERRERKEREWERAKKRDEEERELNKIRQQGASIAPDSVIEPSK